MSSAADPVKLQDQSTGVLPDHYRGPSIRCEYYQDNIATKAEKYIFRCSIDKVCCGGQCCVPIAAAGFPLWLIIVILVLCFLLVILLLCILAYYCCNNRNRKAAGSSRYQSVNNLKNASADKNALIVSGTPPKVEIYKNDKSGFGGSGSNMDSSRSKNKFLNSNQRLKDQEHITVLTDIESGTGDDSDGIGGSRRDARGGKFAGSGTKILPFEPSPMEESFENAPRPIPVTYHDRSEISGSSERRPLVTNSRLNRPEEQKARMVYYKSEANRTESFNEHAEYEDD